jgi:amino acid adenylation domain-containing protein
MTTAKLISELRSLDVKIWSDNGELFCNAPKGVLTADLRAAISERKAEILAFLSGASVAVRSSKPLIRRVPRDQELPLSFAQQRLWLLEQLEPGTSAFHMSVTLRLIGGLNTEALERSLDEIVRRHEALRTTFTTVEDRPVQIIAALPPLGAIGARLLKLPVIDLQGIGEAEREAEALRRAREEIHRPFNLAADMMLRAGLLRLGAKEHIFFLVVHHIVCDGWSMGILYRELSVLYEAYSNGRLSPLPELPIQYADFAKWQRNWLQGEVLDSQVVYWKGQLHNLPVLELPMDHLRPAVLCHQGAGEFMVVSKSLTEALRRLSRAEGVTLFMTLLAAFKILLQRHAGQDDISVGSPIANRNRAENEPLIGLFLNTLVLRTDLSNNPSFRELLARVREVCLGAYTHQDLPFEKLVEELHPQRNLNRHPLFDILFNFDDSVSPSLNLAGLTIGPPELTEPLAKFALTLYAGEQQGQLHLRLVYQKALFSAERMRCFLEQFEYLLEQIVAHPEKPIRDYSLVTLQSRSVLPDSTVILPEPQQELVTRLFTGWARRTPDQPAVSCGKRTWTYDELARQADMLARFLVLKGVKRGEVVAVYGTRSFDLICSVMGVLSSGGVLLLIDRDLPVQRQQTMLRQAGVKILVQAGEREPEDRWLEQESDLTILSAGAANGRFFVQTSPDLKNVCLPELAPNDAAYIFFTSGTTGVPKGVLGCHKGLSHFLGWQRETFAVGPDDRVAQLTNLSFDPVLRDIFLPLSSGATLCLPDDAESLGPDETLSWLENERISILHTVPTLAQSWLAHSGGVSLKSMRWVFFAGEPLLDYLVRQWRTLLMESRGEIVNLYGPTETTLAKCFYRVPTEISPGVQPVGCPLPQTQALVLGESNQPCGIGELGEIVLRTPFRSLGYVNVSEEYRKRFIKNPFRDDERDLLYYTGDRGRYRPDGVLEIHGRSDDQVKIRGVRIELGEVTAVLSRHRWVNECIVTARKDDEGQTCLVAYVVAANPDDVKSSDLRVFLSKQLPAAMIPSAFVFLARLPLTPNGKVDRQALPAPEQNKPERDGIFVVPRNPVEETLAEIWKEILHIERVGVHDNFFDLGGHSLLATRVISRVHNAFQVVCPLRNIFETPTIAGLAERIETLLWAAKQFQAPASINLREDHVELEL